MRKFLRHILPFLALGAVGDDNVYKKLHSTKVRFNKYYRFHDKDRDRQLRQFSVHGELVMAYSKKDAITRWVHMDLKNRRKRRR